MKAGAIGLGLLLAAGALTVSIVQQAKIGRLERQISRLSSGDVEPASAPAGRPSRERLALRVAALEKTVSRLFQLVMGASLGARRGGGAGPDVKGKVTDLREDVDALLTGEALKTPAGRKRLHELIRQAQEKLHAERRKRHEEFRRQMMEERMKELAKRANLSAAQVASLTKLFSDMSAKRHELFGAARRGEKPFTQVRTEMRALRTAAEEKVKQTLSDDQYKEYQKLQSERRGRRRRGWP